MTSLFLSIGLLALATTGCKKDDALNITLQDFDGNVYKTVTLGTQIWMAENLKTTKFNDGTAITLISDNSAWGASALPSYCWYSNDGTINKNTYGALYNWNAVNSGKLCPTGWHVPTDVEWTTLTSSLGIDTAAGAKLKEIGLAHWLSPNTGATNETNFTALPGGYRSEVGVFFGIGNYGYFWSSTENNTVSAWNRSLSYGSRGVGRNGSFKQLGFSVRCLKN